MSALLRTAPPHRRHGAAFGTGRIHFSQIFPSPLKILEGTASLSAGGSFLPCPNTLDAEQDRGPAWRGGAFAPYKRFAAGKTLAEAEFTSAEHFKFPRYPKRNTSLSAGVSFWRRHPDLNRGIRVLQTLALPLGYVATHYMLCCLYNSITHRYKKYHMEYSVSMW